MAKLLDRPFTSDEKRHILDMLNDLLSNSICSSPDGKYTVADVVLREREPTGKVISITSYHKLFNHITGKRIYSPERRKK